MSFKSSFWDLEDAGGSWLGFGILILFGYDHLSFIYPWSTFLLSYLDFEDAKNILVLYVLILGFGGCWRFLTGVWHLYPNLDMITCLWYTNETNFGSESWFKSCKEHLCPLSHHMGLWRTLEVPDWVFLCWSWFGYGHWSLIYQWSDFWLYLDFKGAKNIHDVL